MLMEKVDLDSLGLSFGDARQVTGNVSPEVVTLGGQAYLPDPSETEFKLDISRTSAGYAMRLRFTVGLAGPCFRCLEPALAGVKVDAREVDQPPQQVPARGADADEEDEDLASSAELESPYVENGILDLAAWTHDALILSLPNQIVCREQCAGLCPHCGESLNGADPAAHDHGQNTDPRWAKLRELG